jgi:predicted SAM-dependent methyltransferase
MSRIGTWLSTHPHPEAWQLAERAAGGVHWSRRGHLVRRRLVSRYLGTTSDPKLQIGAWRFPLAGWLNSDLVTSTIHLDLRRPLPLPDSAFAYVFGEHVIEHLSENDGVRLLTELRRILRPGGVLRLTTPDLRKIVDLYEDRNEVISWSDYKRYFSEATWPHERPCQILNTYLRHWGHKYVYDQHDLTAKLLEAGFAEIERCGPGQSRHAALTGVEQHDRQTVEWVNEAEAMSLEGTRPLG